MLYEWDEAKNRSNFAKHGLDFADAEQVFTGPCVTFADETFRLWRETAHHPGPSSPVGAVVIAHALRGDDKTRIISMRKANRREQKIYQEATWRGLTA